MSVHDNTKYMAHDFEKYNLIELTVATIDKMQYGINVTENHLFYYPISGNYRMIGDIGIGEKVYSIYGNATVISKQVLTDFFSEEIVYDIHIIEGPKNYFVNGVLVHNKL